MAGDALKKAARRLGKDTPDGEIEREFHDRISGQGSTEYQQLLEEALNMLQGQ